MPFLRIKINATQQCWIDKLTDVGAGKVWGAGFGRKVNARSIWLSWQADHQAVLFDAEGDRISVPASKDKDNHAD